jgi:hypothetical protein
VFSQNSSPNMFRRFRIISFSDFVARLSVSFNGAVSRDGYFFKIQPF